jgi:hypothetical protein
MKSPDSFPVPVLDLIKCDFQILPASKMDDANNNYIVIPAHPATGVLYITNNNPEFISGHVRLKGKDEGRYPYKYLEMIENIFGKEDNTIEVCSRSVRGINRSHSTSATPCFTVDINLKTKPDLVGDAQTLDGIPDNKFNRWRCDPPYNQSTAKKMYGTNLPVTGELLKAGARVCKVGSLLFLLLGPKNHQWCPYGIKRIGWIAITVVPNNEVRALNIFYKYADCM